MINSILLLLYWIPSRSAGRDDNRPPVRDSKARMAEEHGESRPKGAEQDTRHEHRTPGSVWRGGRVTGRFMLTK